MTDDIQNPVLGDISNLLNDIAAKYQLPCFVFTFPILDKNGRQHLATFAGQQDAEIKNLFQIEISIEEFK